MVCSPFNDSWQCSMKMNPDTGQRTRRFFGALPVIRKGVWHFNGGMRREKVFLGRRQITTNTHPLGKRGRKNALHAPAPGYDGVQAAIVPASLDKPVIGQRGGGAAGTGNQNGADGGACAWEAATIKGMAWSASPVATGCQDNPCSTGSRWGVSPAAQMGCLRKRSGSPSGADQL